jgi:hypothetical protein
MERVRFGEMLMKTLPVFLVVAVLGLGCFVPGYALARTNAQSQARGARKAEKKQAKAQKKYAKAQRKAERKMLKNSRKNTHYPSHPI